MLKNGSCCGCICTECEYFPADCPGCAATQGKPFWLRFTGDAVCSIFHCCVEERGLPHCGKCAKLPCVLYEGNDPTKTPEENAADHQNRLEQLKRLG